MGEKEKEVLEAIETFINENGYSPTVREICELVNLKSTSSVHGHIKRLKAKGYLTSGYDMPRSIVLAKKEKTVKFVVNAIALRYEEDKVYVMLEENKKEHCDDVKFKLPGGVIKESENIYGCIRREFKAKGFKVTKIFDEEQCKGLTVGDQELTMFEPFCISQYNKGKDLIISNTIVCEVGSENVRKKLAFKWVCTEELGEMIAEQKENICAHTVAALNLFCKS